MNSSFVTSTLIDGSARLHHLSPSYLTSIVPEKFHEIGVRASEWSCEMRDSLKSLELQLSEVDTSALVKAKGSLLRGLRFPTIAEEVHSSIQKEMIGFEKKLAPDVRSKLEQWRKTKRGGRKLSRFPCRISYWHVNLNDPAAVQWSEINIIKRRRRETQMRTYRLTHEFSGSRFKKLFVSQNFATDAHGVIRRRRERQCLQSGPTASGIDTGTASGIDTGTASGIDTGTASGIDTGTANGIDTGTASGMDTGTASGMDTGTASGIVTGTASGMDTGTASGMDTATASGMDTAKPESQNASLSATTHSNTCTNSGYITGPEMVLNLSSQNSSKLTAVDENECIITVSFYQPVRGIKSSEFDILGSQTLADLRDAFFCDEDVNFGGVKYKGACFYINGRFYADVRDPNACDYSHWVGDYLAQRAPDKIKHRTGIAMHTAKLCDLEIALNQKCAYLHQGDCEHRVTFTAIRLFEKSRDCLYVQDYPVRTFEPTTKTTMCQACTVSLCQKLIFNASLLPTNPSYLCNKCTDALLHDEYGGKVQSDDFIMLDYQDIV